jgi:nicotinamide mononucleotide transporter
MKGFLMMWRFKEQWLLYIVLNIVSIAMWVMRFSAGDAAGDLMILMWSLFLLNALFGCWRWHTGCEQGKKASACAGAGKDACCED